ncbi:MAG TPA: hypothetical protein VL098_10970 [Flavipsychrobacter sp.]|nr:hypothetical protein [Flavipsychrobacter sp.]
MLRKFFFISCFISFVFASFAQKTKKQKNEPRHIDLFTEVNGKKIFYNEIGAPLPPLSIYRRDGKFLTNATLENDAHLIVMLFNPTCEHCENMAATFKKNIDLFKKTNLVLVATGGMFPYLDYFIDNTHIKDISKIQVGIDSSGLVNQTFLYKLLPQVNVYNKERKLEKVFFSDVPIDSLKSYID